MLENVLYFEAIMGYWYLRILLGNCFNPLIEITARPILHTNILLLVTSIKLWSIQMPEVVFCQNYWTRISFLNIRGVNLAEVLNTYFIFNEK